MDNVHYSEDMTTITPVGTFPQITLVRWTQERGPRVIGFTFEAKVCLYLDAESTSCGHTHRTAAAAQACGEKLCRRLLRERARTNPRCGHVDCDGPGRAHA